MKRLYAVLFLLLFAFSATIAAVKGPSPEELTPIQPDAGKVSTSVEPRTVPSTPMMEQIYTLVEARQARVAELNERAIRSDFRTRQALQSEIREIKQQMYIDVLAVRAQHARLAGYEERAVQIEAEIEEMKNPKISARRVERDPHTHRLLTDQQGGGR